MCVGVCTCVCARQNNVSATHTREATSVPAVAYRSGFDSASDSGTGCGSESVSFFQHPTAKTQAVTFHAKPATNSRQPTRQASKQATNQAGSQPTNQPGTLAAWQSGRPSTSSICRTYVGYNFILLYFQRRCLLGYFIQIRHV